MSLAKGSLKNGQAKISLSKLKTGVYDIYMSVGDFEKSKTLYVVNSTDFEIKITPYDEKVLCSGSCLVEFDLPNYADGNIIGLIDGKEVDNGIFIEDSDYNNFIFDAENLTVGEHTFTLKFTSQTQKNSSDSFKFTVVPALITIPDEIDVIHIHPGLSDLWTQVTGASSGKITVLIDGNEYKTVKYDGSETVYFPLNDVSRGVHNLTVKLKTINTEVFAKAKTSVLITTFSSAKAGIVQLTVWFTVMITIFVFIFRNISMRGI